MMKKKIGLWIVLWLLVVSCGFNTNGIAGKAPASGNGSGQLMEQSNPGEAQSDLASVIPTLTQTPTSTPTTPPPTQEPTQEPTLENPPDQPAKLNPLTGLPVTNADNLSNPPALVSVTNWPYKARPQAGLSSSPMVFEFYIGEGMSRFLALFYGDYPSAAREQNQQVGGTDSTESLIDSDASIGPIRSGRLYYEHIRQFYNGFLVMASAYKGVAQNLSQFANIFGSDEGDINSAMIGVDKLEAIAQSSEKALGEQDLSGMEFDVTPPAGGISADRLWFFYNELNQIVWEYDQASGGFERYQFTAEQKNTFVKQTDRLTGEPLNFKNIVILFANHRACKETAFDIDLMYVNRGYALVFRDGAMYKATWTTKSGEYERKTGKARPIRFLDESGNPFPFKPGQTWVHIVPTNTRYWESSDSEKLEQIVSKGVSTDTTVLNAMIGRQKAGTASWAMRYYVSLFITDEKVCEMLH